MAQLTRGHRIPEKSARPEVVRLGRRVQKILEDRGLTKKWLYEHVGMSAQGWEDMWTNGSIKVAILLGIGEALNLDPLQLLYADKPDLSAVHEPAAGYGHKRYLEDRMAELEDRVAALERKR